MNGLTGSGAPDAIAGREDVAREIAGAEHALVPLAQRLIRAPSPNPPGDESGPGRIVDEFLADLGGVERTLVEPAPGRVNQLYSIGPADAPALLLAAHLDTVPVEGDWTVEPFGGELVGDRVYGRGATDNKGAVAALATAFRVLHRLGSDSGRVILLVNADEEAGGHLGVDAVLAELGGDFEAAVVAEPSGVVESFEALWVAARGASRFRVEVAGTPMHSSLADRLSGTNAVEGLMRIERELRSRLPLLTEHDPDFGPRALLVPVSVDGDGRWGTTSSRAGMMFDLRLTPGVERESIERELRAALAASSVAAGLETSLEFAPGGLEWVEPSNIPTDHLLVESTARAWSEVLGSPPTLGCFPGGTDARSLTGAGIAALPGLGPGCLARAHAPDEFVTVDELGVALRLYVCIALHYLAAIGR